jgi:prepilin-type N-terminal cleavage/methylation domain-containing protein
MKRLDKIKSFTLVELLIVIAILAVLAAAVVIVLNPAELLAQARDGQRSSDMKTISDALSLFVVDTPSASLGTAQKVYISIPDANTDCSGVAGLPVLPTGWTYNCVTSATLKNIDSTGWIPIDLSSITGGSPIPYLPVDPQNTINSFYSYIAGASSNYAVSANIESVKQKQSNQSGVFTTKFSGGSAPQLAGIPQGGDWVKVPGNSAYGTSDFSVMKYEARCIDSSGSALFSPTYSTYEIYQDPTTPCSNANSRYISSRKDGYVIANVTRNNAKAYCVSIGAHLVTNEEWMTIARDIERVSSNWSNGAVGDGYLYRGHSDNSPARALQASMDSDPYYATGNTPGTQKRVMTLSNGENIWDFAGNLREHVQRTSADLLTIIDIPACSDGLAAWGWCQFGNVTAPYISGWTADVSQNYIGPSNATTYDSNMGVGQVYTYKSGADQGTTVFNRGGHWSDSAYSGIYALRLDYTNSATYHNLGFRCAK